jgi:carbonic anhydrase
MENKGIMNDCDIISVAGVVKCLANDKDSVESKFLLSQISLSIKLHHIKRLYILHHTDCGAYGGHAAFNSLEEEEAKHIKDMQKASEAISELLPEIEIKHILLKIDDDYSVSVVELN